jgi:hypothetical protein
MQRAAPAVTQFEDYELIPLEPSDAPQVIQLLSLRGNSYLIDLGASEHEVASLISQLAGTTWSLPLAILRGDECIGMATTSLANTKSLNASLLAIFTDPANSMVPLALFIRHAFWNFPLHRLHCHIPALDLTAEYVELLTSVGFVDEGRLRAHELVAGQPFDVVLLGLLREEFELWCRSNAPGLTL